MFSVFFKQSLFSWKESEDDLILQYSHKKFDRQGTGNLKRKIFEEKKHCDLVIKKVLIFHQKDSNIAQASQDQGTNKR